MSAEPLYHKNVQSVMAYDQNFLRSKSEMKYDEVKKFCEMSADKAASLRDDENHFSIKVVQLFARSSDHAE